jgi:hypothetical protein
VVVRGSGLSTVLSAGAGLAGAGAGGADLTGAGATGWGTVLEGTGAGAGLSPTNGVPMGARPGSDRGAGAAFTGTGTGRAFGAAGACWPW